MKRSAIVLVLLCSLLMPSCQNKRAAGAGAPPAGSVHEQINQPLCLDKAIVGQPSPLVSVLATIDLTFNEEVVPPHAAGTTLDKSPFVFKPAISGTTAWISQTVIRFTPEKPMASGTEYTATFCGKEAFGSQRNVDNFTFSFKTAEQEVVDFSGDFEPDSSGQNLVRFKGVMNFAQPVDARKVERDLKCSGKSGAVDMSIAASAENPAQVTVVSKKPLKRGATGQILTFSLPKSYTVDRDQWTHDLLLPEINVFKVIARMDLSNQQAQQTAYGFRFSDPIKTGADLAGYVTIEPQVPFTVSADKKFLKLAGNFIMGREYTVTISKGFPSAFGTRTADVYTSTFSLDNIKPDLQWLSEGVYLPSDNNFKLQFKSVNVARVRVRITEIYQNNLGFFIQNNVLHARGASDNGGGYEGEEGDYYSSSSSYSDLNRVGEQIFDSALTITSDRNKWIRSEFDLSGMFKGKRNTAFVVSMNFGSDNLCGNCTNKRNELTDKDLYYEEDDYYANPCNEGYYYRHGELSKLLIASDIGLTLKSAGDGMHVYAVDVISAKPASGLNLGLYSYQNQRIEQQTTDGDGHALFSKNNGYYVRGETGSGLALIKCDHPSWETSSFDIAGFDEGRGGVNMFIYADRGVHRPGDTVHLAAIIRSDRKTPPADQPVRLRVYNPRNQLVHEASQPCGWNGHLYFAIPTGISDPTGDWRAMLSMGGVDFNQTLKIETVKPNRLKVEIDAPDTLEAGSVELAGTLRSRYLFGTPAAGLNAKIRVDLSSANLLVPKYKEYTFSHPMKRFDRRDDDVIDDNLDDDGSLRFSYSADDVHHAPELVRGLLTASVFEKGGGFTSNSKRVLIVPYRAFVGIKNPFDWNGARTGESYQLPIIVTDIAGKAVAGHPIKIVWYVNRGYWWWDYDSRSKPDFRTLNTTYKIGEYTLVSRDAPVRQQLDVEDYGQHFVEITDQQTGHSCGIFFYASSWGAGAAREHAERSFLTIASNKNMYYTGDKAVITCETPAKGLCIFTLEQGNRILMQEIKAVTGDRTSVDFDVTGDMVPNCYAVVSLIQPHGQTSNDAPLRIYGIKPLAVEDFSTRLQLVLKAPDEIKPNEKFRVSVSSSSPDKASYTIAIVDEGLLDLTGFATPDPWKFFFRKLRLGIVTRDNLEDILGIIFPDVDRRFSIGGDMEEQRKRAGESKVQRFKPVVLYSAPQTIKPGETKTTEFTMPNYVGSVRMMIVGASQNAYASVEKTVPVRQPLMVLTTIPRVARPGDRFLVPVSVFAMDKSVTTASVKIAVSGPLELKGNSEISVGFDTPGEKEAVFELGVKAEIGVGKITVTAQGGGHSASDEVDLPITCPNPYYIQATDTMISGGKSVTLTPGKFGIEGTNKARFSFTRFPDIQVHKRYRDLIHYPYGCIEQTTSSAFPQLYIGSLLDLTSVEKQMIVDNINAAIDHLSRFKINGGFSYWPLDAYYSGGASEWGTLYAGHFLIEAKAAGYHVPDGLYDHWLSCAKHDAKTVNRNNHRYQCYRLYLLAQAGAADGGAMNLVRENYLRELDPLSKKLLAAAFYRAGQKDAAREVDKFVVKGIASYREMSGTFGSSLRDQAMIAQLCYIMGDLQGAASVLKSVAGQFNPWGWYSTQEVSFALMAISTIYAKSPMTGGAIDITAAVEGGKTEKILLKGYQASLDANSMWGKAVTISTPSSNPLFITLFEEGIPLDDRIKTEQKGIELTRNFYDDDGGPMTLDDIRQGGNFWVRYRVRSTTREQLSNLALSSLLPSGWEIINLRLEGVEPPEWVKNMNATDGTYMDIRDDRVNWFFDLGYNGESNFVVKCNPTFAGSYRLPPVTVEPMYSPDYYARIAGENTEVR